MIDLDDLIDDDDFFQTMTVWRRQKTYDANGLPVDNFSFIQPQPSGSIQSGANPELLRQADMATTADCVTVYSAFRLFSEGDTFGNPPRPDGLAQTDDLGNPITPSGATEYRPDVVMYKGNPYEVFLVNDWTDYGAGFVAAIAKRITTAAAQLP